MTKPPVSVLFKELRSALHLPPGPLLRVQAALMFTLSDRLLGETWEVGAEEYLASWLLKALPTLRQDLVKVFSPRYDIAPNPWGEGVTRAPLLHPVFRPIHPFCSSAERGLRHVFEGGLHPSFTREYCLARLEYLYDFMVPTWDLAESGLTFWNRPYEGSVPEEARTWALRVEEAARQTILGHDWKNPTDEFFTVLNLSSELINPHLTQRANFHASLFLVTASRIGNVLNRPDILDSAHPAQKDVIQRLLTGGLYDYPVG